MPQVNDSSWLFSTTKFFFIFFIMTMFLFYYSSSFFFNFSMKLNHTYFSFSFLM